MFSDEHSGAYCGRYVFRFSCRRRCIGPLQHPAVATKSAFIDVGVSLIRSEFKKVLGALFLATLAASTVQAQGEDGTRAERNLLIIAEMLPGQYDNTNQAYFDKRLNEPLESQHGKLHGTVERVDSPEIGQYVFIATIEGMDEGSISESLIYSLAEDDDGWSVRMKFYAQPANSGLGHAVYLQGCDVLWLEEAGQFRATRQSTSACLSGSLRMIPEDVLLSENSLWIKFEANPRRYYTLERARNFSCSISVPGVGGGRETPYKRYHIPNIHDRGGQVWTTLDDGREVSITLQVVRWPMNSLENVFARHAFVIYVGTRENGVENEVSYAWAEPDAQRIGINLKWMLVHCFMVKNEDVTPFFKKEPIL